MNKKKMNDIFTISKVFASSKRLLILEILSKEPIGYTEITNCFNGYGIPIGSSEMYKHLDILINNGFVSKKKESSYGKYFITKKGMVAVDKIKEIAGTEAKVAKIRMEF